MSALDDFSRFMEDRLPEILVAILLLMVFFYAFYNLLSWIV